MTSFYSPLLLTEDKGEKDRYGNKLGLFVLPDMKEFEKKLKKYHPSWVKAYLNDAEPNYKFTKYAYNIVLNDTRTFATISIVGVCNNKYEVTLAKINLSTVYANCGSLLISNLHSEVAGTRMGTFLFKQILSYAEQAGYSFLLLNTAGSHQNPLGEALFEKKFGFIPMKKQVYINKRSGNANIWYYKFLSDVRMADYDVAIKGYNEQQDEEEDEEDF